jgi:hypothetical protein
MTSQGHRTTAVNAPVMPPVKKGCIECINLFPCIYSRFRKTYRFNAPFTPNATAFSDKAPVNAGMLPFQKANIYEGENWYMYNIILLFPNPDYSLRYLWYAL